YPHLFSFNDTAPTEIYTLSLHDALPILTSARLKRSRMSTDSSITMPLEPVSRHHWRPSSMRSDTASPMVSSGVRSANNWLIWKRSEEHTSELQSRRDLVCRLLLEKKKKK